MRDEEMNCKDICELLTAYLDGEVTPEKKVNIEGHLPSCPRCRAELEALSAARLSIQGALKSMAEEVTPPVRTWEKIRDKLDKDSSWLDGLCRLLGSKVWKVAVVTAVITAAVAIIPVVSVILRGGGQIPSTESIVEVPLPLGPPPPSVFIFPAVIFLAILVGILMMVGLAFGNRFARSITGIASVAFGAIGIYFGLYALLVDRSDLFHINGVIPVFGLIMGITAIKRHYRHRLAGVAGMVLCLAALVLDTIFAASWRTWVIAVTAALPLGIILWAFRHEIKMVFRPRFTTGRVVTASAVIMVLVVAVAVGQFGGFFRMSSSPPPSTPIPHPSPSITIPRPPWSSQEAITPTGAGYSVQIDFVPSRTIYMPGEQTEFEVILSNQSTEPVIISRFPPEVSITQPDNIDEGKVLHTFFAGTGQREFGVNETVSFKLNWDQRDENGNQVPPGWYYRQTEVYIRTVTEPANEWITGDSQRAFLIQYPQGAMEKVIDLDLSQTVTGLPLEVADEIIPVDIVLTLKRVELTREGVSFFVLLTSPDYPLPGGEEVWWRLALDEHAEYVFDGVTKDARGANTGYTKDGIEFRWGSEGNYRDPIPSDTKELTFIITRLGDDWEGPWEFKIPLE